MVKVEIHNAISFWGAGRSTITTLLDALGSVWFEYKLFVRILGLISQLSDTSMFSDLEEFLFLPNWSNIEIMFYNIPKVQLMNMVIIFLKFS